MANTFQKPGPAGGTLARIIVKSFRELQTVRPDSCSYIHSAFSGGTDSLALTHLLAHHLKKKIPLQSLIHINHSWRGSDSDADFLIAKATAKEWGLQFFGKTVPPEKSSGESAEARARAVRKGFFREVATSTRPLGTVLTAHTADDLAETVLWRILTGTQRTHGAGILTYSGVEFRPLLRVRKKMLEAYLKEEGLVARTDTTNSDPRFLRNRIRLQLMPIVEQIFPRAIEHLVELGLGHPASMGEHGPGQGDFLEGLRQGLAEEKIKLRKSHYQALAKFADLEKSKGNHARSLSLPSGWVLKWNSAKKRVSVNRS